MLTIGRRWKYDKNRGIPIDSKTFAKSDTALQSFLANEMLSEYVSVFYDTNNKRSSKRTKTKEDTEVK
jgi:hypothetical protein